MDEELREFLKINPNLRQMVYDEGHGSENVANNVEEDGAEGHEDCIGPERVADELDIEIDQGNYFRTAGSQISCIRKVQK
jgi:hypothetical protein